MKQSRRNQIIALAYFHRYGWILTMMLFICLFPEKMPYLMSGFLIVFSLWTVVGYRLKWKHIFCSWQNASHMEMTPHSIRWSQVPKSDVYFIPVLFTSLALLQLYAYIRK